jgi:hypothetical protein
MYEMIIAIRIYILLFILYQCNSINDNYKLKHNNIKSKDNENKLIKDRVAFVFAGVLSI